jgi:hypothetical protein
MSVALGTALAGQLTLTGIAKWRTRHAPDRTLLNTVFRRVPVGAFVAGDLLCAAALLPPRTAPFAAGAVLVALGTATVLGLRRSALSCGCFGTGSGHHARWREAVARALFAVEALAVAAGHLSPVPASAGWAVAGWVVAAVLTAAMVALQPQLVTDWRAGRPLSTPEALRLLGSAPQFVAWRPMLLSDRPSQVTGVGRAARLVFDAWRDDRPLLLIATVSGTRIRLETRDAVSLAPVVIS